MATTSEKDHLSKIENNILSNPDQVDFTRIGNQILNLIIVQNVLKMTKKGVSLRKVATLLLIFTVINKLKSLNLTDVLSFLNENYQYLTSILREYWNPKPEYDLCLETDTSSDSDSDARQPYYLYDLEMPIDHYSLVINKFFTEHPEISREIMRTALKSYTKREVTFKTNLRFTVPEGIVDLGENIIKQTDTAGSVQYSSDKLVERKSVSTKVKTKVLCKNGNLVASYYGTFDDFVTIVVLQINLTLLRSNINCHVSNKELWTTIFNKVANVVYQLKPEKQATYMTISHGTLSYVINQIAKILMIAVCHGADDYIAVPSYNSKSIEPGPIYLCCSDLPEHKECDITLKDKDLPSLVVDMIQFRVDLSQAGQERTSDYGNYFKEQSEKISDTQELIVVFKPNNPETTFLEGYSIIKKLFMMDSDAVTGLQSEINTNTIYYIRRKVKEEEELITNPELKNYQKKLENIKKLGDEHLARFYDSTPVPPDTIAQKKISHYVEKEEIRKFSKPLDTLYLKERDTKYILNVLKNYKNGQKVFDELGIPKKLGILVHGEPGTGKTTTILAIANYLNLDIFYVDLNGVTKYSELREIIDYIKSGNVKNGMIVFEDIDAMTPVVHRRDTALAPDTDSLTSLMKSETLTLSHLLGLFDGTLCGDNNVFALSTNHLEKLDPAIYRSGRVDINIEFTKADSYQVKMIFKRIVGRDISPEILERVGDGKFTPADVIFTLMRNYYERESLSDSELLESLDSDL